MKRSFFCWLLMLLLLFASLPASAETPEEKAGENALPEGVYRMEELEETPFGFSGVAEAQVYWLDRAGKEKITVCRFESAEDFAACRDMIKGYGLMRRDGLWYPDCDLPYTWFVSEELMSIALYEGTDESVALHWYGGCQLLENHVIAGGYFFDFYHDLPRLPKGMRLEFVDAEGVLNVYDTPSIEYHMPLRELLAGTDAVCIGRVTRAPQWPDTWEGTSHERYERIAGTWRYEIEVLENVAGIHAKSFRLSGLQPGCLSEGYTYLLFLKLTERENGSVRVTLANAAAPRPSRWTIRAACCPSGITGFCPMGELRAGSGLYGR